MDDRIDEHPIEVQIAAEREERKRQEADFIEAFKKVRTAGPTIKIGTQAEWNRLTRGRVWIMASAPIRKYSINGSFMGWYHHNQKRGMPSLRSPVERSVEAAYKERETSLRRFIDPHDRATILGRKSGRSRASSIDNIASQALALMRGLTADGIPKHQHAHKVARILKCSPAYVRRVLREKKAIAIKISHKINDSTNKKMSPERN